MIKIALSKAYKKLADVNFLSQILNSEKSKIKTRYH